MLEGKTVNLKVIEKDDLPLVAQWFSDPEVFGEFNPIIQYSKAELEKYFDELTSEEKWFFIEKKDGTQIGEIHHLKDLEIGYCLIPTERRKGYCTEAVKIMVDYLFLSKDAVRIYALTNVKNVASQKVLEKAGFKKEGVLRKSLFIRGEWRDRNLHSILREEWKETKILTKTTS